MSQRRSNLTFVLGAGASELMVDRQPLAPSRIGLGGRFEVGYTYLTQFETGLHTGIGIRYGSSGFAMDRVASSSMGYISAHNADNSVVRSSHFTAVTRDVREHYNVIFLDVPLYLVLQQKHTYLNIGLRLLLPVSAKASCDYGPTSVGVGYQIDGFGQRVETPIELQHFDAVQSDYVLSSLSGDGTTFLGVAAFSVECGYRWFLDKQRQMIISMYADVGINRSPVGDDKALVVLENGEPVVRSCMQSNLASTLRYIDIGVSLTYSMSFGRRIGEHRIKAFKPGLPYRYRR